MIQSLVYAVSAVRLMRIELGGAFADLLNERGKGSGDNEMGYVERTLGFRTRDLDDRDLRLVCLPLLPSCFVIFSFVSYCVCFDEIEIMMLCCISFNILRTK